MAFRPQFRRYDVHSPKGFLETIIFPAAFLLITFATVVSCRLVHWS